VERVERQRRGSGKLMEMKENWVERMAERNKPPFFIHFFTFIIIIIVIFIISNSNQDKF